MVVEFFNTIIVHFDRQARKQNEVEASMVCEVDFGRACVSEWLLEGFIAHFFLYILQMCCILHYVLSYITWTATTKGF